MKKKLAVAVIGIGNMGKNHVRTYSEMPEVNLVAVVDLNKKAVDAMAAQYGIKAYTSTQDLLKNEKVDAVSICVPTTYHYSVAKEYIMSGIHVLIEKPITADVSEAKELLQLAKKKKVKLHVGHIERFNPAIKKVKELIENGSLGKITAIIARRVGGFPPQIKDANISVDLVIHDVDIINYLLDDLPKAITIHTGKHHIEKREDSAEFFLQYKHASAYVQANWITPVKIRKLNITGTEGYLEMDYVNQKIEFYQSNYEKLKESADDFSDYVLRFSEPDIKVINIKKKEPLREELLHFIKCVEKDIYIDPSYAVDALVIVLQK